MAENTPSAFLSYSWSSSGYADRVEQLAKDLTNDGIHVLLDLWDLREGQDKHAFMEKCVSDPTVDRVLILIDPRYVERANRREGGVGTETLIISGEVYASTSQEKFVAVVMEKDQEGKIVLPIYLKDRLYIDLSDPETYSDQYERLVRNLHGKPERTRPPLGRRPAYLDEGSVSLQTGQALSAFRHALAQDRATQAGYFTEYLERLAAVVEGEEIQEVPDIDDLELRVAQSIDTFLPYRNEYIELINLLGQYGGAKELYARLHGFFERLVTFRFTRPTRWSSTVETENLNFLVWELFLYTVSGLLRSNRLAGLERLLRPYYVRSRSNVDGVLREFDVIDSGFPLIQDVRQKRLGTRLTSAPAQLLFDRVTSVPAEALIEADSVLWVRSTLTDNCSWWPHTAVYRDHYGFSGLPVWSRARGDAAFFAEFAPVLGVPGKEELIRRLNNLGDHSLFHVGFVRLNRHTIADMLGVTAG